MFFSSTFFDPDFFDTEIPSTPELVPVEVFLVPADRRRAPFLASDKGTSTVRDYAMDWAAAVPNDVSISAFDVRSDDPAVSVDIQSRLGSMIEWRLSGGTVDSRVTITVAITLDNGTSDDQSVRYNIRNR